MMMEDYAFVYTNEQIRKILKTAPTRNIIYSQYLKYIGRVCRGENNQLTKLMLFAKPQKKYYHDPWRKNFRAAWSSNWSSQEVDTVEKWVWRFDPETFQPASDVTTFIAGGKDRYK